jgi:ribonuclease J
VRACIRRGAREVGGSCVELEHDGARLVLDMGLPLDTRLEEVPLPAISGLSGNDSSLIGVIISHGHPDHYGLAMRLHASVPLYVGEATERLLREAMFFGPMGGYLSAAGYLVDRVPLRLGPFVVRPFLVDHSAFDAYALLIEAGGRRLFYSGDLRGHGRKASLFEQLLADPPSGVHTLLMEGTHVRSSDMPIAGAQSEQDLESACTETFRNTTGMVLACYSAQNIDRLVTLFKATLRSNRDFVMDLYTATIAAATGYDTIPQSDWDRIRVYLPSSQRRQVIREEAFERTHAVRSRRIYPEELVARRSELVMTFRESMATDLERAGCLADARLVWSMWPGYLDGDKRGELRAFCDRHSIPMTMQHVSGHAAVKDLQRLATAIRPHRIVPIHTSAPERFREYFPNVERRSDGQWWSV